MYHILKLSTNLLVYDHLCIAVSFWLYFCLCITISITTINFVLMFWSQRLRDDYFSTVIILLNLTIRSLLYVHYWITKCIHKTLYPPFLIFIQKPLHPTLKIISQLHMTENGERCVSLKGENAFYIADGFCMNKSMWVEVMWISIPPKTNAPHLESVSQSSWRKRHLHAFWMERPY